MAEGEAKQGTYGRRQQARVPTEVENPEQKAQSVQVLNEPKETEVEQRQPKAIALEAPTRSAHWQAELNCLRGHGSTVWQNPDKSAKLKRCVHVAVRPELSQNEKHKRKNYQCTNGNEHDCVWPEQATSSSLASSCCCHDRRHETQTGVSSDQHVHDSSKASDQGSLDTP